MTRRLLTIPQLMFVIGTRAALAAGVALLVSERLTKGPRRAVGLALMGLGAATTVPALKIMSRTRPTLRNGMRALGI
jgi:hypothetical protein